MDHFVGDLAVVLGVAAITSVIFRWMGQSTVLGYLFAGLVVGPYLPFPIFADAARISELSEFGVVLVMFAVGLEFSLRRLLRVLPLAGFTALVQLCALGAAGFGLAQAFGLSSMDGVFLGSCMAISSTMVVAKVFSERPPEPRVREFVFGILVVQDLAAIVLVAVLTAVTVGSGLSPGLLGSTVANLAMLLVATVVVGLLVVPRFVRLVADLGNAETLLVGAVALCFGLATLAEQLGYSVALGAFLAGTLVAEAGRTRRVLHLVHPLRDLFAAVFFISVGMSVDPRVAFEHLGLTLAVAAVVIAGQFSTIGAAGVLSGNGLRRSIIAGLSLGQVGEFAFIIAAIGVGAGVVGEFLQPVIVTVAVATAFTTPLLVKASHRVVSVVDHLLPHPIQTFASLCESWFESARTVSVAPKKRSRLRNSLIVIAVDGTAIAAIWVFVNSWRDELARWIGEIVGVQIERSPVLVVALGVLASLPLVVSTLRAARRAGQLLAERVVPERESGAMDLGLAPRRAFVVTLQSMVVLAVSAPVLVLMVPLVGPAWALSGLAAIVVVLAGFFWRSATHLQGHVRAGAAALAELLGRQLADEVSASLPSPEALLPGLGTARAVDVAAGAFADGRTLAELDVRAATGATMVAISRGDQTTTMPSGRDRLQAGDRVVLAGAPEAVEAARRLLGGDAGDEGRRPQDPVS